MGFIIFLIVCAALYAIYRLVVAVDEKLQKNRKNGIVVREPEEEEEKQAASTALRLYGKDSDLPILVCRQTPESEEKHDKTLILFFLIVLFVVVAAVGLVFALL